MFHLPQLTFFTHVFTLHVLVYFHLISCTCRTTLHVSTNTSTSTSAINLMSWAGAAPLHTSCPLTEANTATKQPLCSAEIASDKSLTLQWGNGSCANVRRFGRNSNMLSTSSTVTGTRNSVRIVRLEDCVCVLIVDSWWLIVDSIHLFFCYLLFQFQDQRTDVFL